MADRSIRVTLRANVADFNAQINSASRSLEGLAKKADSTGEVAGTFLGRVAQSAQLQAEAWTTVGSAVAVAGAAMVAVTANAVSSYADFDQAMDRVQVSTRASAETMDLLREAALDAGRRTVFTATEAAAGIDELAKAGVSASDILGGALDGALDLAAAGELSVADAAEIAATALTQFNLRGSEVSHVADLLAAGAAAAQGGVSDLAFAMRQGGLVANQMGLSVEDTVGTLTAFAAAGLIGSDAGTSFRTMMIHLMAPTKRAKTLMDELGISVYDASGQFVGMEGLAGQLQSALSGLSAEQRNAALATIFGMDAIRGANVLYQEGAEGIRKWTNTVNDQGFAAESAATRMDNLKGDIERLSGAWETAQITAGESMNGVARYATQMATDVLNAYTELPEGVQKAVNVIALSGGAVAVVGGAAMAALPRVVAFRTALVELGVISKATGAKLNGVGGKMRGLGTALGAAGIAIALASAGDAMNDFTRSVEESENALLTAVRTGENVALSFNTAAYSTDTLRGALNTLADPSMLDSTVMSFQSFLDSVAKAAGVDSRTDIQKMKDDLASMGQALASMDTDQAVAGFKRLAETLGADTPEAMADLLDAMPALRNKLVGLASDLDLPADDATLLGLALGEIEAPAGEAADSIAGVGEEAESTASKIEDMVDALMSLPGAILNARDAARDYREAVSDAWETMASGKASADDLEEALDGIADSAWDLVDALSQEAAADGFVDASEIAAMSEALRAGREDFVSFATAMGMSEDEANALADALRLIPEQVTTTIHADTEPAQAEVEAYTSGPPLANGSIQVSASLDEARENLMGMSQEVDSTTGTMTITGDTLAAQTQLAYAIGIIDNSDGTVTILGDDGPVIATRDSVKAEIDKTTGDVTITGRDNASNTIQTIRTNLNSLQDRTVTVTTYHKTIGSVMAKADGGAVYGPGTGTSDSIPAMLSAGEHVLTAAEVQAAGGQGAIYRLRSLIRQGRARFAEGGAVIPSNAYVPPMSVSSTSMPPVNLTVVVDNPLTGEQIRQVMTTVADGRIVYSNHLNR